MQQHQNNIFVSTTYLFYIILQFIIHKFTRMKLLNLLIYTLDLNTRLCLHVTSPCPSPLKFNIVVMMYIYMAFKMGSGPILSVKGTGTITQCIRFDRDGYSNVTCKQLAYKPIISIRKILECNQIWHNSRTRNAFSSFCVEYLFEFLTIGVSVRLSDRSLHREERKKICQKLPPVGFETRSSGSSDQCLTNWAKSTFSCQPESSWPL